MSIDAAVDLPSKDAMDAIAKAMGMAASSVLAGLNELLDRGYLKEKCTQFPGLLPVPMLFACRTHANRLASPAQSWQLFGHGHQHHRVRDHLRR